MSREFRHQFTGPELLDELLAAAGATVRTPRVLELFREGLAHGKNASEVIPSLFDREPRFPDPELARTLYQNLLGLWDLLAQGKPVRPARSPRPKKLKPTPPAPWSDGGPSPDFVEAAWRYLEDDPKARQRLTHAFENRQDALLTYLDEQGLSDEGYGVLRYLLFELHAMFELGSGQAPSAVDPVQLARDPDLPAEVKPLEAYAEEAIFEAEQDPEAPLSPQEARQVRSWARRALGAWWQARAKRG